MKKDLKRYSKFMSLCLRHRPETAGLALDGNGWADVNALIAGANRNRIPLTLELVKEIVDTNEKKRFSLSEDGTRIRANQGHSIKVDVELKEASPPEVLYHGTATRNESKIREEGLFKMNRQHVHLSPDQQTAVKVGQRHGKPIVLRIRAQDMGDEGFVFYLSENGVWLTDRVPSRFII